MDVTVWMSSRQHKVGTHSGQRGCFYHAQVSYALVLVNLFDGADMRDDHFNGDAVVDAVVKNLMDEVVGIIQVFKYSVCSPTS